mmetsp:Transcript_7648/g.17961  ORF Transcript_7648/g.17961 Transcript_7648/m.17961 type:complete len:405 (-) Transcript_7648:1345-2559(-)
MLALLRGYGECHACRPKQSFLYSCARSFLVGRTRGRARFWPEERVDEGENRVQKDAPVRDVERQHDHRALGGALQPQPRRQGEAMALGQESFRLDRQGDVESAVELVSVNTAQQHFMSLLLVSCRIESADGPFLHELSSLRRASLPVHGDLSHLIGDGHTEKDSVNRVVALGPHVPRHILVAVHDQPIEDVVGPRVVTQLQLLLQHRRHAAKELGKRPLVQRVRMVGLENCLLVNHLSEPFLEQPIGREEFALVWLHIQPEHVDSFHRDVRKLKELLEHLLALQLDGMCHRNVDLLHRVGVIRVEARKDLLRESRLVPDHRQLEGFARCSADFAALILRPHAFRRRAKAIRRQLDNHAVKQLRRVALLVLLPEPHHPASIWENRHDLAQAFLGVLDGGADLKFC